MMRRHVAKHKGANEKVIENGHVSVLILLLLIIFAIVGKPEYEIVP